MLMCFAGKLLSKYQRRYGDKQPQYGLSMLDPFERPRYVHKISSKDRVHLK